jgi:hypothetical protein
MTCGTVQVAYVVVVHKLQPLHRVDDQGTLGGSGGGYLQILLHHFDELCRAVKYGGSSNLRQYGITRMAQFSPATGKKPNIGIVRLRGSDRSGSVDSSRAIRNSASSLPSPAGTLFRTTFSPVLTRVASNAGVL